MRKMLKNFFYGNIKPCEREMVSNSSLHRSADKVARCERQLTELNLTERLGESEQALLTELVKAQHEVNSITALENFILGFRLGIRMMAECMDENDGDIREITDQA